MISSSYWALERFYYQSKHSIVLHKFLPPPLPILVGHLFTNMHTSTTIYLSLCLPRCFTSLQFKKNTSYLTSEAEQNPIVDMCLKVPKQNDKLTKSAM